MWTSKTPYTSEEKTRAYIEKRGRLALSRALNIGRVVGFVASGATSGYGHIDWGSLVAEVVQIAINESKKSAKRDTGSLRAARDTLERFRDDRQLGKDATHILGLASNLANLAGRKQIFREEAAKLFSRTRQSDKTRLLKDVEFEQTSNPLRNLISELRLSRFLTLNYDAEIEEEFRRLYRTSGTSRADVLPPAPVQGPDDKTFGDKTSDREDPESAFDVLCDGDKYHRALQLPRRVEYSDGTSRSVLSVSMSGENISDLINFALHPRQFVGQVLHLHGRYDKPLDMVLTDEDYRQTYMKSDEDALCFEEALSALHNGNDILFVGSGMREADILRPLRQFISQDKSPDFAQRHVFAMLENKVTLDDDWLENTADSEAYELKKDFSERHLKHAHYEAPITKGATRSDFNTDEQEALRLRNEFGVFALFHGGEPLRLLRLALMLSKRATPRKETKNGKVIWTGAASSPRRAKALRGAIRAVHEQLSENKPDLSNLLSEAEFRKLEHMLKETDRALNGRRLFPSGKEANLERLSATLRSAIVSDNKGTVSAKKYLDAIETEIRSRALSVAVRDIETGRRQWWQDWRAHPKERNAKFRPRYIAKDKLDRVPTHARHRPIYSPLDPDKVTSAKGSFSCIAKLHSLADRAANEVNDRSLAYWKSGIKKPRAKISGGHIRHLNSNDLDYFECSDAGLQRDFALVPPRRILRGCMPRGFGKGSLLHILQQQDGKENRLVLDSIFPDFRDPKPDDQIKRYHGAFCLHLSFSMEFASVIKALKEFIEDALIGVMIEYPGRFLQAADTRLSPAPVEHQDSFLHFLYQEFQKAVHPASAMRSALEDLDKSDHQNEKILELKERAKTTLKEEMEKKFWRNKSLSRGRGRMHRLEELRLRLSAYTDVVDVLKTDNLRLFLAMSGLDKLCDDQGSAYNPMFRALFRILTGCGAKYASESDVTTPLDILLISGTRGEPIRYLTPEKKSDEVKTSLKSAGQGAPLDFTAPRQTETRDHRKIYLKDWPIIPPISINERYWLKTNNRLPFWEMLVEDEEKENHESTSIRRSLSAGVALSSWCAGAIDARLSGTMHAETHNDKDKTKQEVRKFIDALDSATARGGIAQVLREILEVHKVELRAWGGLLEQNKKQIPNNPRPRSANAELRAKWPQKQDFASENRAKYKLGSQSAEGNRLVELTYVILAHLALFPMPVEPRVLYGCDEIYDLLKQICDFENSGQSAKQKSQPHVQNLSLKARAIERNRRLRVLNQVLQYLNDASLVIAVRGKSHPDKNPDDKLDLGGDNSTPDDVHTRFTIQHQLRDFCARLMDLSVPDQGERNFFQNSIYCDQPKDLPSPNENHYRMVRDVIERQIIQSRNTIWCMTQLVRKAAGQSLHYRRDFEQLSQGDKDLAKIGLRRRLFDLAEFDPGSTEFPYSANFESLHAVPQRIRALYGLLRSGFSIGTISRLAGLEEHRPDQPYERFRGWLRGITNAAIGWDTVVDELLDTRMRSQQTMKDLKEVANATQIQGTPPKGGFARPLYRDEIGWLLNERGLVALVTGNVFDAIPLFQRALDEMHHDDVEGYYDPSLHAAVRRVHLNMAIALIERGHLDRASASLKELHLSNGFSDHSGSQVSWLASGYFGLVQHLSGDHAGARESYREVIEISRKRSMMRSVAIFSKHLADLERRNGNFQVARSLIQDAIDASLQCVQRDIFQLAQISKASLELSENNTDTSTIGVTIRQALNFSHSMGVPRIEIEALRLQSTMMLAQGDRMLAGRFASRAAAIANRNGLRLHKLSALVTYGKALRSRGDNNQADQILEETKREAERRGYQCLAKDIVVEARAQ